MDVNDTENNSTEAEGTGNGAMGVEPLHVVVYVTIGIIGMVGNFVTCFILCSSASIRNKTINMFLISQSLLDFLCALMLVATAWQVVLALAGGHFGFAGKKFASLPQNRTLKVNQFHTIESHADLPIGYKVCLFFYIFSILLCIVGILRCYLWDSKHQLWNFLLSSTCNLVALNIERWLSILYPVFHKTSFTKKHAIIMILMAWLFGPLYNLARMVPTTRIRDGICVYNIVWPNQFWFSFTSVITCIIYLFFPLTFIMSLYLSIFLYLRKKASTGPIGDQANKMDKAKTNVLKTLVALTVCFFLCWIWNVSFFFLFSIGVSLKTTTHFYHFSIFMLNINCCINPFCYALQYREFQKQARRLFCRGKFSNRVANSTTENTTESTA